MVYLQRRIEPQLRTDAMHTFAPADNTQLRRIEARCSRYLSTHHNARSRAINLRKRARIDIDDAIVVREVWFKSHTALPVTPRVIEHAGREMKTHRSNSKRSCPLHVFDELQECIRSPQEIAFNVDNDIRITRSGVKKSVTDKGDVAPTLVVIDRPEDWATVFCFHEYRFWIVIEIDGKALECIVIAIAFCPRIVEFVSSFREDTSQISNLRKVSIEIATCVAKDGSKDTGLTPPINLLQRISVSHLMSQIHYPMLHLHWVL